MYFIMRQTEYFSSFIHSCISHVHLLVIFLWFFGFGFVFMGFWFLFLFCLGGFGGVASFIFSKEKTSAKESMICWSWGEEGKTDLKIKRRLWRIAFNDKFTEDDPTLKMSFDHWGLRDNRGNCVQHIEYTRHNRQTRNKQGMQCK